MLAQQWITVAPWLRKARPFVQFKKVVHYTPTLAAWGAFGGIAALYFLEPTPLARTDIFQNIPVVGEYWKEKLEAAQKKD